MSVAKRTEMYVCVCMWHRGFAKPLCSRSVCLYVAKGLREAPPFTKPLCHIHTQVSIFFPTDGGGRASLEGLCKAPLYKGLRYLCKPPIERGFAKPFDIRGFAIRLRAYELGGVSIYLGQQYAARSICSCNEGSNRSAGMKEGYSM